MAVIEFARNILGWKDAQSTEFDKTTSHPMVIHLAVFEINIIRPCNSTKQTSPLVELGVARECVRAC